LLGTSLCLGLRLMVQKAHHDHHYLKSYSQYPASLVSVPFAVLGITFSLNKI